MVQDDIQLYVGNHRDTSSASTSTWKDGTNAKSNGEKSGVGREWNGAISTSHVPTITTNTLPSALEGGIVAIGNIIGKSAILENLAGGTSDDGSRLRSNSSAPKSESSPGGRGQENPGSISTSNEGPKTTSNPPESQGNGIGWGKTESLSDEGGQKSSSHGHAATTTSSPYEWVTSRRGQETSSSHEPSTTGNPLSSWISSVVSDIASEVGEGGPGDWGGHSTSTNEWWNPGHSSPRPWPQQTSTVATTHSTDWISSSSSSSILRSTLPSTSRSKPSSKSSSKSSSTSSSSLSHHAHSTTPPSPPAPTPISTALIADSTSPKGAPGWISLFPSSGSNYVGPTLAQSNPLGWMSTFIATVTGGALSDSAAAAAVPSQITTGGDVAPDNTM